MYAGKTAFGRIRTWSIWELPRWLAAFIVMVVAANAAVFGLALTTLSVHGRDLELLAALVACSAATVELTRRAGENSGLIRDVHAVWELPVAILLPYAYIPLVPAVRLALTQWRIRRSPVHRRVFSASAVSLSYFIAGLVFHWLTGLTNVSPAGASRHAFAWMLFVATCSLVQWAANQTIVLTAVKGSNPAAELREVFAREAMHNDLTELCVAVVVTFCVASSLISLAFAFPFVSLLQRSLRHAQLLSQSRADSKTGLLNAATWEREAAAELKRAVRTGSAAAVALLDLDRFKLINDTYGHLLGDQVLKDVAAALTDALREYDLAGRFGGEEFVVLLPQTKAVDAFRIAERLREHIAKLAVLAPDASSRVPVTVSIGVAAMDAGSQRELTELMAAADAALYRAKASGRNQVQMISTSRGLSASRSTAAPDQPAEAVADEVVAEEAVVGEAVADGAARLSTASISELPEWHSEALPVRSTSGVG
jgi:diguanylate cyclase (GGDEF)-like protein